MIPFMRKGRHKYKLGRRMEVCLTVGLQAKNLGHFLPPN